MFVMLLASTTTMYSQVVQRGNVFTTASKRSVKKDTVITKYYFEVKGKKYSIILNRTSGKAYIWRTSKKGTVYRQYLPSEVATKVSK